MGYVRCVVELVVNLAESLGVLEQTIPPPFVNETPCLELPVKLRKNVHDSSALCIGGRYVFHPDFEFFGRSVTRTRHDGLGFAQTIPCLVPPVVVPRQVTDELTRLCDAV